MPGIVFSTASEDRGQAEHIQAVIEALRPAHEVFVFAPGSSYDFLSANYPSGRLNVFVRRISALRPLVFSGRSVAGFLSNELRSDGFQQLCDWLGDVFDDYRPVVAVTDREPALTRIAARRGVPLIRLDSEPIQLVIGPQSRIDVTAQIVAAINRTLVNRAYRGRDSFLR